MKPITVGKTMETALLQVLDPVIESGWIRPPVNDGSAAARPWVDVEFSTPDGSQVVQLPRPVQGSPLAMATDATDWVLILAEMLPATWSPVSLTDDELLMVLFSGVATMPHVQRDEVIVSAARHGWPIRRIVQAMGGRLSRGRIGAILIDNHVHNQPA